MKIKNTEEIKKTMGDMVEAYKVLRTEIDKIPANEMLTAKIYLLQRMVRGGKTKEPYSDPFRW